MDYATTMRDWAIAWQIDVQFCDWRFAILGKKLSEPPNIEAETHFRAGQMRSSTLCPFLVKRALVAPNRSPNK